MSRREEISKMCERLAYLAGAALEGTEQLGFVVVVASQMGPVYSVATDLKVDNAVEVLKRCIETVQKTPGRPGQPERGWS